jgi:hypothetical protein
LYCSLSDQHGLFHLNACDMPYAFGLLLCRQASLLLNVLACECWNEK